MSTNKNLFSLIKDGKNISEISKQTGQTKNQIISAMKGLVIHLKQNNLSDEDIFLYSGIKVSRLFKQKTAKSFNQNISLKDLVEKLKMGNQKHNPPSSPRNMSRATSAEKKVESYTSKATSSIKNKSQTRNRKPNRQNRDDDDFASDSDDEIEKKIVPLRKDQNREINDWQKGARKDLMIFPGCAHNKDNWYPYDSDEESPYISCRKCEYDLEHPAGSCSHSERSKDYHSGRCDECERNSKYN